jgi:hypothetical protein
MKPSNAGTAGRQPGGAEHDRFPCRRWPWRVGGPNGRSARDRGAADQRQVE